MSPKGHQYAESGVGVCTSTYSRSGTMACIFVSKNHDKTDFVYRTLKTVILFTNNPETLNNQVTRFAV